MILLTFLRMADYAMNSYWMATSCIILNLSWWLLWLLHTTLTLNVLLVTFIWLHCTGLSSPSSVTTSYGIQTSAAYIQGLRKHFYHVSAERCYCKLHLTVCLSSVCKASVLLQSSRKYHHAIFTAKQLRVSTVSMVS